MKCKLLSVRFVVLSTMVIILALKIISCSDNSDITGAGNSVSQNGTTFPEEDKTADGIFDDDWFSPSYDTDIGSWTKDFTYEPEPEPEPEEPEKTFPEDTYMWIRRPFGTNVRVSYQDTETLDQLWKDVIDRTDRYTRDGKRRGYLKTENTRDWVGKKGGNFYFDDNYNIRWEKKSEWVMKIFRGGAIIKYLAGLRGNSTPSGMDAKGGRDYNGRWAIAGLYSYGVGWHSHIKTLSMEDETKDYAKIFFGQGGPGDGKYEAMTDYREVGKTEVLVLHEGMTLDLGTGLWEVGGKKAWNLQGKTGWTGVSYAAQIYLDLHDRGSGFWKQIRGQNPNEYMGRFEEKGPHQIYKWGFRFAFDRVYSFDVGYSGSSGTKW